MSHSAIGMYEQGRREPSIDILIALSNEFGVTLDYLITGNLFTITDQMTSMQLDCISETLSKIEHLSRADAIMLLLTKISKE